MAFVAQDVPLYQHLPVEDMVRVARTLNDGHWDQRRAGQRLAALGIPVRRKIGKLSGGQQAQVALTIALARRPEVLVLDEPLARLDPLARHEFLAAVMETAAEAGTSVLFSSHVVAELERAADYLVVVTGGRVRQADRWRRPLPAPVTSMAWVVWRQHRSALTWLGALLLALGATMLGLGIKLHQLYAAEIRHGCLGSSAWSHACRPLQNTIDFGWPQTYSNLVMLAMQAVPVIIGVFLGAPLLAREYASGTVRFAWTQGIGRTRWAVATLGLLGAAVAVVTSLLGLLPQWSVQPVAPQTSRFADRWEPGFFDCSVLTAATSALLAFAIGVLAGALIRRVVAAIAVAAACTITVASLAYNRMHYWLLGQGLRLTRDMALGVNADFAIPRAGPINIHETVRPSVPGPAGAWLDQGWYTGADGRWLSNDAVSVLLARHAGTGPAWLARLHDTFWVTYQPGSRYWLFQLILAGGTLLAAVALAAATVVLIRHRRA